MMNNDLPTYREVTDIDPPSYGEAVLSLARGGAVVFPCDFYEDDATIPELVTKANRWLATYKTARLEITSVEIVDVKWHGMVDTDRLTYSYNTQRDNPYRRVLRLWLKSSTLETQTQPQLGHQCIEPVEGVTSFEQMAAAVNRLQLPGEIVSIRTIRHKRGSWSILDLGKSRYTVKSETDTVFFIAAHVFFLTKSTAINGDIEKRDFMAKGTVGSATTPESYSRLFARTSDWIHSTITNDPMKRFINLESVYVKIKSGEYCDPNRLNYTIHHDKHTYFALVIRVWFFHGIRTPSTSSKTLPSQLTKPIHLKTFVPRRLEAGCDDPHYYESIQSMKERIKRWLKETGAHVVGTETNVAHMYSGGAQKYERSEATSTYFRAGKEHFLYIFRYHINGPYVEQPDSRPHLSGECMVSNYDSSCAIL